MKRAPLSKAEIRTQKLEAKQRIKDARALVISARKARRAALVEVRAQVKAARKALPAKLAHWREINRQIMRRAIEGERHAVRAEALTLRTGTEGRAHELAKAANKQIDADLRHLRWLGKARHKVPKNSARVAAGMRAAELRAESDDFTRDELPPEFHPAWEEHKHKIKAGPRVTRWEAALDYFHNHPEAVIEANERELERGTQALIEREHAERYGKKRAAKKAAKRKPLKPPAKARPSKVSKRTAAKRVRVDLSDVPF